MKITIVGTAYPLRGGIAHYNALLAQALSVRHDVHTITFKRQYPALLFPGKSQLEEGEPEGTIPAPRLVDSISPLNWWRVGHLIRHDAPDLLLFKYWLPFFGPCFGTIARSAKRGTSVRVLYICDNVIPHERRPGDRVFTRYAFGPADFFIVQSDAVEQDLKRMVPGAVYRKVPHPVYESFGTALGKREARAALQLTSPHVLLFFGYVRAYKGLHVLLEAMATVVRSLDVHLLVVGEFYDDERKYRQQVQALHLGDHVTIHANYVPNDRVREYFSAADAVVLPYISATQSGIAQIAFNFERPVIATDVGGLAEVIRTDSTGIVVPPGDASALANAIVRFYREGKERAFSLAIREEKHRYSWSAMVEAIEDLSRGIR